MGKHVLMGCAKSSEDAPPAAVDEPMMNQKYAEDTPCEPILAITTRDCIGGKDKMPELLKACQTWSDFAYAKANDGKNQAPGFKTMAFFQDPNNKDRIIDFQWFNSVNAFKAHIAMTNVGLMQVTMACEAFWDSSEGHAYRGYAMGSYDQKVMMGMTIPEMFEWSMFPMAMKAENRQHNAGFMNNKKASSPKPPLIILTEELVKEGEMANYQEKFKTAAAVAQKDPKVIAFYSTQQCLKHKLSDPLKKERIKNKVVNIFAFETIEEFDKFWPSVAALKEMVTDGPSGCIWGDAAEDTKKAKESIGACAGDMVKQQGWLGVNEMVVCPPYDG